MNYDDVSKINYYDLFGGIFKIEFLNKKDEKIHELDGKNEKSYDYSKQWPESYDLIANFMKTKEFPNLKTINLEISKKNHLALGDLEYTLNLISEKSSYFHSKSNIVEIDLSSSIPNLLPKEESFCAICLDDINDNMTKLDCGHKFHSKCINLWIEKGHKTCPMCRKSF